MNKACKTYYKNFAINYSEICDELGNPEEIVADYYSNEDSSYLTKNLRFALLYPQNVRCNSHCGHYRNGRAQLLFV